MNQIEKKEKYQSSHDDLPMAYTSALYLTNRQVSWLIASLILLSFFIFLAGYFLGQRTSNKYDSKVPVEHSLEKNETEDVSSPVQERAVEQLAESDLSAEQFYKAQLIGFGTLRAANQFVDRLQQKNLPVRVQERHSKTAQGKEVIWYQVTTELFNDKQELTAFVERIQKEERLKDIRIIAC